MSATRLAVPDMVSPSYFPAIAAVELGFCRSLGLDVELDLVFPVTDTYEQLKHGDVDYVAGAAHAALYAFDAWEGVELLCALSQHMYWFLVTHTDLGIDRGNLEALAGLRIGAAPGPVDGLRIMLADAGVHADSVRIGPVAAAHDANMSFGVAAADALERGDIDGFWANGMGAEVAVRRGVGTVVVDARRGDGPPGTRDLTFAALSVATSRTAGDVDEARRMTAAIVAAQKALVDDPALAEQAAAKRFPAFEASLISELIARDAPFYDPAIGLDAIDSMTAFARRLDLPAPTVPQPHLIPTFAREAWIA